VKRRIITLVLVFAMAMTLLSGCGDATASTTQGTTTGSTASSPSTTAPGGDGGTIKIGLVTAVTGSNSLVGEYAQNGFKLAQDQINAEGGILGKKIELALADEVDNLDASIKATQQLLADKEVAAIIGSMYSTYCIAALPSVAEAKVPFFSSGSSSGVSKEKNPYTWQVRPLDTAQGKVMADYVVNTLKLKNPAILHSTQSALVSQMEQTVKALKELGMELPEANMFAFPEEESNFAPYLAQIKAGGFDGLLAFSNQQPAAVICQQADLEGINADEFPCVGSTSFCSAVCLSNAGSSANGWYSVSDWVPGGVTETAAKFEKAYVDAYGEKSDLPAVIVYDALRVIAEACEIAGTTEDKEAINAAIKKIEKFPGAVSDFSYYEDHSFANALGITRNSNGKAEMITSVTYR
jgi:branched-chain amino acid transport system substrate-binding protein